MESEKLFTMMRISLRTSATSAVECIKDTNREERKETQRKSKDDALKQFRKWKVRSYSQ